MRLNIEIPNSLYTQLKVKAVQLDCSIEALIVAHVRTEVSTANKRTGKRVSLPLIKSTRPGHLNLTNSQIDEILEP